MITLGSVNWGESPIIPIKFEYEKQRSGADMQYRVKVTVSSITGTKYFGYPIYFGWAIDGYYCGYVTLKNASPKQWSNEITYTTAWHTVSNKAAGTTGLSVHVYSGSGSSRSNHYGYSMAVDPAASEITASNGTLGTPLTINVTRYNTAFTDTITFTCGGASGTVCSESKATSVTWGTTNGNTVDLAAQNTTGAYVTVTLTVTTYSGYTPVGSNSIEILCAIPDGVKPSVALAVEDVTNYYNTYGAYVQGWSKLKITADPTLAQGSPIKAYTIAVDGKTYDTNPVYTEVLQGSGPMSVTAKVIDRRERPSDLVTEPITVLPYARPTVSVSAYRCNSSGEADDEGAYMRVGFTADISDLNGKNGLEFTITYSGGSGSGEIKGVGTSHTSGPIACDVSSPCTIEVTVNDKFSSATKSANIPIAFTLMDYYHTGAGVSFGKVATRDGFDCAMEAVYFNNNRVREVGSPVAAGDAVPLGFLKDYIVDQGTNGIWTYRKWNSGIAECRGIYVQENVAISNTWGNLYESAGYMAVLPDGLFVETPVFSITLDCSRGAMLQVYSPGTTIHTPHLCAVRPYVDTIEILNTSIVAYGRWK